MRPQAEAVGKNLEQCLHCKDEDKDNGKNLEHASKAGGVGGKGLLERHRNHVGKDDEGYEVIESRPLDDGDHGTAKHALQRQHKERTPVVFVAGFEMNVFIFLGRKVPVTFKGKDKIN